MAVKDGPGLRPVAQTAKRHFLNRLETSSKPWLCLPAFILHSSGPRTPSQGQNTMAVKDGPGLRPVAQTAKRHFLNRLFKPWLCLLAFILHSSRPRTLSQGQNTIAVKDGPGLRPVAQTAKRHFLNRLETSSKPWLCLLAFILHSSGPRTLSQCQNTMAVKDGPGLRPVAQTAKRHFLNRLETSSKPWLCLLAFILHSSGPRTPSQGQNTMAVKDGPGLRPVAQTAKRHFLNRLETSSKPWLCLSAFILHSSGPRTPSQGQNTMAVKDGSGLRPVAQTAKRHFLNRLETSSRPWLCLLAFILHSSGPRTLSQGQNTIAVKDGPGLRPVAQTAKRHFLNRLETSSKPWLCLLAFILHSSGPRTPSQSQNTMAVKDGPGLRPVAQTAKRHFLNRLETSSKPWLCLERRSLGWNPVAFFHSDYEICTDLHPVNRRSKVFFWCFSIVYLGCTIDQRCTGDIFNSEAIREPALRIRCVFAIVFRFFPTHIAVSRQTDPDFWDWSQVRTPFDQVLVSGRVPWKLMSWGISGTKSTGACACLWCGLRTPLYWHVPKTACTFCWHVDI